MPLGNPLSRLATNNKKSTLPRSKRALDSHSIVSYRSSNGQESDTSHTHRSTRRLLLRPKCSSIVSDREGRRATITHERNYYFSPPPPLPSYSSVSRGRSGKARVVRESSIESRGIEDSFLSCLRGEEKELLLLAIPSSRADRFR